MNDLLKQRFEEPFTQSFNDKKKKVVEFESPAIKSEAQLSENRNPASIKDSYTKKSSYQGMVWIILIFFILGGYFAVVNRSE